MVHPVHAVRARPSKWTFLLTGLVAALVAYAGYRKVMLQREATFEIVPTFPAGMASAADWRFDVAIGDGATSCHGPDFVGTQQRPTPVAEGRPGLIFTARPGLTSFSFVAADPAGIKRGRGCRTEMLVGGTRATIPVEIVPY